MPHAGRKIQRFVTAISLREMLGSAAMLFHKAGLP